MNVGVDDGNGVISKNGRGSKSRRARQ